MNDAIAAAAAEVPLLDFDEGVVPIVARVKIAGEVFDVPPMPASAIEWFARIKDLRLDNLDQSPWDLLREFILRCMLPKDRDRCTKALDESSMTLEQLMERGGMLIRVATGFPTSPPSPSAPSLSNGSGSTTGGTLPAPAARSSTAPPGES